MPRHSDCSVTLASRCRRATVSGCAGSGSTKVRAASPFQPCRMAPLSTERMSPGSRMREPGMPCTTSSLTDAQIVWWYPGSSWKFEAPPRLDDRALSEGIELERGDTRCNGRRDGVERRGRGQPRSDHVAQLGGRLVDGPLDFHGETVEALRRRSRRRTRPPPGGCRARRGPPRCARRPRPSRPDRRPERGARDRGTPRSAGDVSRR